MSELQAANKGAALTPEKRFTNMIVAKYGNISTVELSDEQKILCSKYFVGIDRALKKAEFHRQNDPKKINNPEISWHTINVDTVASDMITNVMAGLDPTAPNHLNFVPHLGKDGVYTITQITGYKGYEIRAKNQGVRTIVQSIIRLVYSNERFVPNYGNGVNPDRFEHIPSENPFDKGEIVGGYYFKKYKDGGTELRVVPLKEILKRKPTFAAAEFWGGEKDEWVNGKKTGNKVKVDGWYDEMCYKTLVIMCYKDETLDPAKTAPQSFDEDAYVETKDIPHEEVRSHPIVTIDVDDKPVKSKATKASNNNPTFEDF